MINRNLEICITCEDRLTVKLLGALWGTLLQHQRYAILFTMGVPDNQFSIQWDKIKKYILSNQKDFLDAINLINANRYKKVFKAL